MSVILDFSDELVNEECLNAIVELVFPCVNSEVSHHVMGPVSIFNAMECSVVLSDPQSVLEGLDIQGGVKRVSRRVQRRHFRSIVTTVLLLC